MLGTLWALIGLVLVCWIVVVVLFGVGYSRATPEQREECNAQFRKAAHQMNDGIQKWNEERRQARAYKRARNAVLWEVVGKFFKKL